MAYDGHGDTAILRSDLRQALGDLTLDVGDDGTPDDERDWDSEAESRAEIAEVEAGVGYAEDDFGDPL